VNFVEFGADMNYAEFGADIDADVGVGVGIDVGSVAECHSVQNVLELNYVQNWVDLVHNYYQVRYYTIVDVVEADVGAGDNSVAGVENHGFDCIVAVENSIVVVSAVEAVEAVLGIGAEFEAVGIAVPVRDTLDLIVIDIAVLVCDGILRTVPVGVVVEETSYGKFDRLIQIIVNNLV